MNEQILEQIILLRNHGVNIGIISEILGISRNKIHKICKQENINLEEQIQRCKECGKMLVYLRKTRPRVFCCNKCKQDWWNRNRNSSSRKSNELRWCEHCGKAFTINAKSPQKYCSRECFLESKTAKC